MTAPSNESGNFMGLDVGMARVGVAIASHIARLPRPHATLPNDAQLWPALEDITKSEDVRVAVVGLPRGLNGQETAQTTYSRQFAEEVSARLGVEVVLQDEALTSQKAEAELAQQKKSRHIGDVDSLAATYILEDYLKDV